MISQEKLSMLVMPSMNNTHLEDMILMNALSSAADAKDFALAKNAFNELIEHTIVHFSDEEEMMQEKKFPPYATHKVEHDRALKELRSVSQRFREGDGDFELVTAYIDGALAPWMIQHVLTLDKETATFFKSHAN